MRAVDAWCAARGRRDVFAQIAATGTSNYRPTHLEWKAYLTPQEFEERMRSAEFVVAHAGMGTVLEALTLGKPLVLLPRRADLREHRNDHQVATAQALRDQPGIAVAGDESELPALLDAQVAGAASRVEVRLGPYAEGRLIEALRRFIHSGGEG